MYVTSTWRYALCFSVMLLSACASPAHTNTWLAPGYDTDSIMVRVYSPDTYELDGYMVNGKGLEQQIKSLVKSRVLKKMLVEVMPNASLFDQLVAIHIGETNGLETLRVGLIGTESISSRQLLEKMDETISCDESSIFSFC